MSGANFTPQSKRFFTPKLYFIIGIIFNLCLLGFFKYTDFFLENFNAFAKLAHLDFEIPLPHILLPLALSFVTFQQIAFLYDCYKCTRGELNENLNVNFVDYALFISFFPQLIAGPIVHHREMMPQFAKLGNSSLTPSLREFQKTASVICDKQTPSQFFSQPANLSQDTRIASDFKSPQTPKNYESTATTARIVSLDSKENPTISSFDKATPNNANSRILDDKCGLQEVAQGSLLDINDRSATSQLPHLSPKAEFATINYEFLAKGIFIFSIGLFKKVFIADTFAKWADAGFKVVENGGFLNIFESWATSLSYTFQLYYDFSGYCDMAMGLGLMFGIVLPLNFNSPYKSLNIAEFWRKWHITLGRFLKYCIYIPLGGNRVSKILTLRNLFIVAFLSGVWHGAGWGFVIWGVLHGIAMLIHRIYSWWVDSLSKSPYPASEIPNQKSPLPCGGGFRGWV